MRCIELNMCLFWRRFKGISVGLKKVFFSCSSSNVFFKLSACVVWSEAGRARPLTKGGGECWKVLERYLNLQNIQVTWWKVVE